LTLTLVSVFIAGLMLAALENRSLAA
jgi:hypothetical protein